MLFFRDKNAAFKFIKAILKECEYCKKVMKKHLNKSLIMAEEEQEQFQSSNICGMCKKLIDDDDEKVRDHCHIFQKYRGSAHWGCNINLQLTKNILVIFHNLRGYDSHLIFCEFNTFEEKIDVIPNIYQNTWHFVLSKNLIFIDSIQFINSRPEKLVKNFSDDDFKYLTKKFGLKNLELLKQSGAYPYELMDSFKRFSAEKLPDKKCFYSSVKDGTTGDNGKKLDGHISDADYLTCKKNLE